MENVNNQNVRNTLPNNNELPYEYQMLTVLKRYDKLVEENARLRDIIERIDNICPIEELPKMLDYFHEIKQMQAQIDSVKRVSERRKERLDAYARGAQQIATLLHIPIRVQRCSKIENIEQFFRVLTKILNTTD